MSNEENLLNDLLTEGRKFIALKRFEEGMKMFKEAYSLDKWKELYGSIIIPNLGKNYYIKFNIHM